MSDNLPNISSPESNLPVLGQVDFEHLRPHQLSELMNSAWLRGIRIEADPKVRATMARFWSEFKEAQARYSPRTLSQLDYVWCQFVAWCDENERDYLPASLDTVKCYLSQRAQDKHRNTISTDKWAISRVHRETGCPDPTTDKLIVNLHAALVRTKVIEEERIKQASPLRENHLDDLRELWESSPALADRRDLAILVLAYETLLRASEVLNIKMRHLQVNTDGTATLMIPITKTNKSGEPDYAILSRQSFRLIREYLAMAGRTLDVGSSDPLFIGINQAGKSVKTAKPLGYMTLNRLYARAWQVLNLEELGIPCFTAHSTRVGAAQDLATEDGNTLKVQIAGRWASNLMVYRYTSNILATEGAMAIRRRDRR